MLSAALPPRRLSVWGNTSKATITSWPTWWVTSDCSLVWFFFCCHIEAAHSLTKGLLTLLVLGFLNNATTGDLWDHDETRTKCFRVGTQFCTITIQMKSTVASWFSSSQHWTQSWLLFLTPEGFQGHQLGAFHAWWRQRDRLPAGGLQQPHGYQADAALEQAGPEGVPWLRRPTQGKPGHSLREWSDIYGVLLNGFLLGWFPIFHPGFIGIRPVDFA